MPMCGNCAGGMILLGYTVDIMIPYKKELRDVRWVELNRPYDGKEESNFIHSIWKCPHCHSIFLMVEE